MFTTAQIAAIIMLLQAFGVSQATINQVENDLSPTPIVAPVYGSIDSLPPPSVQAIQAPQPAQQPAPVSVAPSCSTTPILSISFDTQVVDLHATPNIYVNALTNVQDGCGKLYPYDVYAGGIPRRTGMNTLGTTTIAITGGNINYFELSNQDVAAGVHPANYPFPVSITTGSASTTEEFQVQ